MNNKILTISVAAYNSEKWLSRCVESFINTNVLDKLDVIIVNDGSTDKTLEIAQKYHAKYPDSIRYIDKPNGGHGSTINVSIDAAKGRYYKIVDSDDWVEKEGLERLVACLEKTHIDVVINPYNVVNADTGKKTYNKLFVHDFKIPDGKKLKVSQLPKDYIFSMHQLTIRTDLLKNRDWEIDEHCFYVDLEYIVFAMARIEYGCYFTFPVYDYLLGTAEQSSNLTNMIKRRDQHLKMCKSLVNYWKSHKKEYKEKEFCIRRISRALYSQYLIYWAMDPEEAVQELRNFDRWIRKTVPERRKEAIATLPIKRGIFIQACSLTGFRGYVNGRKFFGRRKKAEV